MSATKRIQFVWWGWRDWELWFERIAPSVGLSIIYAWWLRIGPLEIRRWVPDPDAALDAHRAARAAEREDT